MPCFMQLYQAVYYMFLAPNERQAGPACFQCLQQ